jgi:flagellar export protein FliJ
MNAFRFSLQKALELRRRQFDLEEIRYGQVLVEIAAIDREHTRIVNLARGAEDDVRQRESVPGCDLAALDHFRVRGRSDVARIERQRAEAQGRAAEQQSAMVEARRRYRLLEKLRERRLAEWESARDRQLDEMAAEAHLSVWSRKQADPRP